VNEIQFSKYDSVYDENKVNGLVDGTEYKFYVQKDSSKNYVYIYGRIGPKEFYGFAKRIELLKQKQKLILINKQVDFGNLYHILLPDPPANNQYAVPGSSLSAAGTWTQNSISL
jgi:hypothetical protein